MLRFAGLAAALVGMTLAILPARAADDACDPLAVEIATTPQRTPGYPNLLATQRLQAAIPDRADAILFGDSLFAGWQTDLPKAFPAASIYDFAVGGDRVPYVLWRIDNTDLSRLKPSALSILIGTNDLAAGTPPCAVVLGIEAIIDRLQARWPATPILVLTIPPRGPDFRELDDLRLEVNRAIVALGDRHADVHPVVIDDASFTCGQYGKPLPTGTAVACLPAGRLACSNYVEDNLHFTTAGYVELGRILRAAGRSALGKSPFD